MLLTVLVCMALLTILATTAESCPLKTNRRILRHMAGVSVLVLVALVDTISLANAAPMGDGLNRFSAHVCYQASQTSYYDRGHFKSGPYALCYSEFRDQGEYLVAELSSPTDGAAANPELKLLINCENRHIVIQHPKLPQVEGYSGPDAYIAKYQTPEKQVEAIAKYYSDMEHSAMAKELGAEMCSAREQQLKQVEARKARAKQAPVPHPYPSGSAQCIFNAKSATSPGICILLPEVGLTSYDGMQETLVVDPFIHFNSDPQGKSDARTKERLYVNCKMNYVRAERLQDIDAYQPQPRSPLWLLAEEMCKHGPRAR